MAAAADWTPEPPGLDTNTRSCSDSGCDEHVFDCRSTLMATAAPIREPAVHRLAGSPRWRPVGAAGSSSLDAGGPCPSPPVRRAVRNGTPSNAARRRRARTWRRRILLTTVAVAALVALALPWGGAGGHPLTTGSAQAGAALSPHVVYVVQPGDTMWSIAERVDPTGDPRVIVADLEAQVGSDTLQVGQHLRLP